jgi:hypothetical protein
VIDTEPVVDVVDQLGDEEVEVRIPLAVRVRRHVDRHPLDARLEIGAVIEVEAANEVLVGLSIARVLRDDEPGNRLEQLAFAQERAQTQVRPTDAPLGGCGRYARQVVRTARYVDGREPQPSRVGRGPPRRIALSRGRGGHGETSDNQQDESAEHHVWHGLRRSDYTWYGSRGKSDCPNVLPARSVLRLPTVAGPTVRL